MKKRQGVTLKHGIRAIDVLICFVIILSLYNKGALSMTSHGEELVEEETYQHVLFLSSYNASFPTVENQIAGIKAGLNSKQIILDVEYMDTKRFDSITNLEKFQDYFTYKLQTLQSYDVVIVGDDAALQFAMNQQETLFKDVPVVFLGINSIERADIAHKVNGMTGVVEITSVAETIDLMVSLQPEMQRLYVIVDNTITGQAESETAKAQESNYPNIEFVYLAMKENSFEQLGQKIAAIAPGDAILLLSAYVDQNETTKDFYFILDLLKENTVVPIYHLYDFGIGSGLLGGKVVDFFQQGKNAGIIAKQVLDGTKVAAIEPIKNTSLNTIIFDYNVLTLYKLDPSRLPDETHFINKPVSYLAENAQLIITSCVIILSLLVLLFLAQINITKRKRVEIQLNESNANLTTYYEELLSLNEELEASEEELKTNFAELESTKRAIEDSEERYKYVFALSNNGLWERSLEDKDIYITRDWYIALLGKAGFNQVDKLNNEQLFELFYSQLDIQQTSQVNELQRTLRLGQTSSYSTLIHIRRQSENSMFIEEKAQSVYNHEGELVRIIGSHCDVTNAVVYERQLEEFAYRDQLTKIPNRIDLERYMNKLHVENLDEIMSGCILLLDIDNFKFVNNTYGHEIGDALLKEIGIRLHSIMGEKYRVGRISGDEFAIICNALHRKSDIEKVAISVLSIFESKFHLRDHSIFITVSIGIALFPENGSDFDTLINRCNSSIYEAKANGKNRYEFYDIAMNESMETKIYIQNNLREAILSSRFNLYYQPIYSIDKNSIIGFEALIRWKDEVRGFIPPSEFIVVAEKMGVITKIGDWVIEEASKFIKYLINTCNEKLYVSINVSAVQLMQQNFVEHFFDVVNQMNIPYTSLCLEITETALMQSFDKNSEKLLHIQSKGVKISLDDFGTGYSSLSYLKKLPVNILKIDKSFIDEIAYNSSSRELSEGIILLAQKMGMYVIAEGIESREQFNYMKDFHCDGIQGYYVARPLPELEVKEFYDGFLGIEN